jgi:hypothetical protein
VTSLDITLEASASLHPGGDPGRFVSTHAGVIRRTRDRDGRPSAVGVVRAYRIHADAADEAGETPFRACDVHSQDLREVHAALFDEGTDDFREGIRARLGAICVDVLASAYVLLSPRQHGLNLGPAAAGRVIDLLGGGVRPRRGANLPAERRRARVRGGPGGVDPHARRRGGGGGGAAEAAAAHPPTRVPPGRRDALPRDGFGARDADARGGGRAGGTEGLVRRGRGSEGCAAGTTSGPATSDAGGRSRHFRTQGVTWDVVGIGIETADWAGRVPGPRR